MVVRKVASFFGDYINVSCVFVCTFLFYDFIGIVLHSRFVLPWIDYIMMHIFSFLPYQWVIGVITPSSRLDSRYTRSHSHKHAQIDIRRDSMLPLTNYLTKNGQRVAIEVAEAVPTSFE